MSVADKRQTRQRTLTVGACAAAFALGGPLVAQRFDVQKSQELYLNEAAVLAESIAADTFGPTLRPGMFAQMTVGLPSERKVLALPLSAVTYNPYGNSVFLIVEKNGGNTAQTTPVQTGETRDGMIEITGGLKLGDQVVSVGQNKLRNGQTVAVDNRVAPPQAVDLP